MRNQIVHDFLSLILYITNISVNLIFFLLQDKCRLLRVPDSGDWKRYGGAVGGCDPTEDEEETGCPRTPIGLRTPVLVTPVGPRTPILTQFSENVWDEGPASLRAFNKVGTVRLHNEWRAGKIEKCVFSVF